VIQKISFQTSGRRPRGVPATVIVVALLLLLHAPAALAQFQVNWTKQTLLGPPARIQDTLVYDSNAQDLVMFGGYDVDWNVMNDIWEYNGATKVWTERTPLTGAQPAPRAGQAMAFDPVGNRVILFGGVNTQAIGCPASPTPCLGDTWEWSTVNKTWTNVTPAGCPPSSTPPVTFSPTCPSAREGARMVYDAANARMILFGGTDGDHFFPDPEQPMVYDPTGTWAWSLTARTWTQLQTTTSSPTGRVFSGRAFPGSGYDSTTNRVTVFGGIGFPGNPIGASVVDFNDIWELRGTVWTDVTPAAGSPPGRGWTQLAYDPNLQRMIMFGGYSNEGGFSYGDTWSFAGGSWTEIEASNFAGVRDSFGMVYDLTRQVAVVFGGYLADVIELTETNVWSQAQRIDRPAAEDAHTMTLDTDRNVVFLYGGGGLEVWELTPSTPAWAWYYFSGPDQRTGATAAFEPLSHKVLLFGGRRYVFGVAGAKLGDTWEWTRGPNYAWTNVTPASSPSPSARDGQAMTYDLADSYPVLFGGSDVNGNPLGDTWLWTGTTWFNATKAGGPSARSGASMTYDVTRGVVVLFGGNDGTNPLNDVWEWNGAAQAWHQVVAAGQSPPARSFAALSSFDAGNPGVALFGGVGAGSQLLNDTWIWNGKRWTQATVVGAVPTARQRAVTVYDAQDERMVLYGGLDSRNINAEQWVATVTGSTPPPENTPGDFDGDGKSDITVFRPSTNSWYVLLSSTNFSTYHTYEWGVAGDILVRGDFDGDGKADVAMYRPSNGGWYILLSSTNYSTYVSYFWGLGGDMPVSGDYDGDGRTDIAVYRPSNGGWYILLSSTNYSTYVSQIWGLGGDTPVPADYDGDGKMDIAVYRPSNGGWYVLLSSTNYSTYISYLWGLTGDVPVPADFDGDGKADIVVYRPSNGGWYILRSSTGYTTYSSYLWGLTGDRPVIGDFDGDGRTDITVYRPSNGGWYSLLSSTGYTTYVTQLWGLTGDVPLLQRP
jgi:hypothetical protein